MDLVLHVLLLLAAWVLLNVALLGAVVVVNRRGSAARDARDAVQASAPAHRGAPVFAAVR